MNMKQTTMVGKDHAKMDHSSMGQQKSMAGMDHSKMKMTGNKKMSTMDSMVTHADTEFCEQPRQI
jgi:hypothetical protein